MYQNRVVDLVGMRKDDLGDVHVGRDKGSHVQIVGGKVFPDKVLAVRIGQPFQIFKQSAVSSASKIQSVADTKRDFQILRPLIDFGKPNGRHLRHFHIACYLNVIYRKVTFGIAFVFRIIELPRYSVITLGQIVREMLPGRGVFIYSQNGVPAFAVTCYGEGAIVSRVVGNAFIVERNLALPFKVDMKI